MIEPSVSIALLLVVVLLGGAVSVALGWALRALCHSWWELPSAVAIVAWTIPCTIAGFVSRGFTPLFPEWTLSYELVRALIHELLRHRGDRMTTQTNAPLLCHQSELFGNLTVTSAHRQNKTTSEPFLFNGLEHVWIKRDNQQEQATAPRHRVVVLYYHGGGYVVLSPRMYQGFASELQSRLHRTLCEQLGASEQTVQVDVLLANYRKAPAFPYPRPPQDALAMYKYLLHEEKLSPHQILVMGDSAGGGLTMTTMLRLRDEDPTLLPVAAILSCPYVDRETKGDERKTPHCILSDRVTTAFGNAYYHGEATPSSWGDASPYHCELRGLPPVYIQAGGLDYILSHSKRLYQKAQESGLTTWTLEVFPNMPHVFTVVPAVVLPSAAKGLDAMAEYAATQFAAALSKR